MFTRTRLLALAAGLATMFVLIATAQGRPAPSRPDSGTAFVSITHTVGKIQFAAGNENDKLLGESAITYDLALSANSTGGIVVTSKHVVLYTKTGSLTGTASALLKTNGNLQSVSNGKLTLTKGAGSLKGDSLKATFTGSANLTTNQIVFHYKGTLIR
jgi:hypothetical protein